LRGGWIVVIHYKIYRASRGSSLREDFQKEPVP
jgi:hypothetical protein